MSNVELMAQAIDFIEAHLQEAITVADIADAASFSLYHFCRTFSQVVHHTPYDYLMRRRLAEAAGELLRADKKIIDIACDYQFNNPETFSRAFRRVFDMQPNQLRKQGSLDSRLIMPRLTLAHLRHIAQGIAVPVLEERASFRVAGLVSLIRPGQTAMAELWELLAREMENQAPRDPARFYGIATYPQGWETRGYFYMAGFEAQDEELVDPALVVKTIPPCKYARFVHTGLTQELPLTLDYIYHTWLPRSGQRLSYSWVIEHYERALPDPANEQAQVKLYIPLEPAQPTRDTAQA